MLKKLILSIFSGLLFFLSWPPFSNLTFLIFFAFVPLYILEFSEKGKNLKFKNYYIYVYLAFFIFNLLTTFWVKNAHFGGAVFAILCNSFFMTLVFYFYVKIKYAFQWGSSCLILPIFWIGFEYLHLNWDLSWPWLTIGNVFAMHPNWVQWYSYTGVLGGTLWVLIINWLIFQFFQFPSIRKKYSVYICGCLLFPLFLSNILYNHNMNLVSDKSLKVLVVQPNIDPYSEKFSLLQETQTNLLIDLVYPRIDSSLDVVILPETFLISPIWYDEINNNRSINKFKSILRQYPNLSIVVGGVTLELSEKEPRAKPLSQESDQWYKVYNTALSISNTELKMYHKSKLVPGAEQMPFQEFLYPIFNDQVLQIGNSTALGNFAKQDSISLFSTFSKNYLAPIICYESIYGDYVRQFIDKGAELICVITNDGWWKKTSGYLQHHAYARLRAIETRRYVARSANTGVSSVINHVGEVKKKIEWDVKDVFEYTIPIFNHKTFYVKYGDFIGRLCSLFSVFLLLYFFVLNKLKIKSK